MDRLPAGEGCSSFFDTFFCGDGDCFVVRESEDSRKFDEAAGGRFMASGVGCGLGCGLCCGLGWTVMG